jgi:hypothetical protein
LGAFPAVAPLSAESVESTHRLLPGFLIAYTLTVTSLSFAAAAWGRAGADLVVIGLGWPHIILGFLFYVNKVVKNRGSARAAFFWLLGITAAIGLIHSHRPITTLIYVYFVFHAFRDEIFIYRQVRSGYRYAGPVWDRAGIAFLLLVLVGISAGQLRFTAASASAYAASTPYFTGLVLCACALVLCLSALAGAPARLYQEFPGLRYAFPSIFLVASAMTAMKISRFHGLPAPLFFSFLVTFHYFSWYVFYLEKLRNGPVPRPAAGPATRLDRWLAAMATRDGFLATIAVLNIGSFAGAYAYQVWHVPSQLAYVFDMKYFLYFLIFHVTMSFAPKGVPKATAKILGSL